jgi:hypothetical protein
LLEWQSLGSEGEGGGNQLTSYRVQVTCIAPLFLFCDLIMSKHTGDGDIHQHGAPINEVNLQQPTPLFERLVTEEVQELKAYVRIVESQNRRLIELERAHGDLESRLEIESKSRQQLEATLEAREREWAEKLDHVESDRDQWKRLVEVEKVKNSKLIDQVVRKDQDIHRMLQRKVRDVPGRICFFCVCV